MYFWVQVHEVHGGGLATRRNFGQTPRRRLAEEGGGTAIAASYSRDSQGLSRFEGSALQWDGSSGRLALHQRVARKGLRSAPSVLASLVCSLSSAHVSWGQGEPVTSI